MVVYVATAGQPVPTLGAAVDIADDTLFAAGTAGTDGPVADAVGAAGVGLDIVRDQHAVVRHCSSLVVFGMSGCSRGGSRAALQIWQEPRRWWWR